MFDDLAHTDNLAQTCILRSRHRVLVVANNVQSNVRCFLPAQGVPAFITLGCGYIGDGAPYAFCEML
jgi:hypothetical protein